MFLEKVVIKNYRNFDETTIEFQDGINIIVGPNNAGKSNLLKVINFLDNISKINSTVEDFNKNELSKNFQDYKEKPPTIEISYDIKHIETLSNFGDAILRLKNFIVYNEDGNVVKDTQDTYTISASIRLKYELNEKYLNEYLSEMQNKNTFSDFFDSLLKLEQYFLWNYYNSTSDQVIEKKEAQGIFNVDFIPADRNMDMLSHTKKYLSNRLDENESLKFDLTKSVNDLMNTELDGLKQDIGNLLKEDQDKIGISNSNNEISSEFIYNSSFSNYFQYTFKDKNFNYRLPLESNGLGYNNLVHIYNIIKFKINNDHNILLIEEPEAHLHPAMQYKLFQYLGTLKQPDEIENVEEEKKFKNRIIKNQIFITTHSSNITASARIEDIISIRYYRGDEHTTKADNFKTKFEKKDHQDSKKHLTKFLDVTRSDLLFTDKVILVEGLAEKMLIPSFAEILGYNLNNNHVSIVEVGGISFDYFTPLFLDTTNKVICFRDLDYKYTETIQKEIKLKSFGEYKKYLTKTKKKWKDKYHLKKENINLVTQRNGGSTFENELFLDNFDEPTILKKLFEIVVPKNLFNFIKKYNFSIEEWNCNVNNIKHNSSLEKVKGILEIYYTKYTESTNKKDKEEIEKLFFSNLFLAYVKSKKGDFALSILTSDLISEGLKVPAYIKEGLEWLKK